MLVLRCRHFWHLRFQLCFVEGAGNTDMLPMHCAPARSAAERSILATLVFFMISRIRSGILRVGQVQVFQVPQNDALFCPDDDFERKSVRQT